MAAPSSPLADSVPRYALYGEDLRAGAAESLHCETIAARSTMYRWEIAAHRHAGLWQAIFLRRGTASITLGQGAEDACGPVLVLAPPGTVHGFRFSEGADGLVLTMAQEFVGQFPADDGLAAFLGQAAMMPLDEALGERLMALGECLLESMADGPAGAAHLLQRALAESFLRTALAQARPQRGDADPRLSQFRELVEVHYREQRPLAFYAAALGCTERTLARLTQGAWRLSPREVIHRRIVIEARRLLRFSGADCASVAEELGFADPSYFSRFYLRLTGRRPGAERSAAAPEREGREQALA